MDAGADNFDVAVDLAYDPDLVDDGAGHHFDESQQDHGDETGAPDQDHVLADVSVSGVRAVADVDAEPGVVVGHVKHFAAAEDAHQVFGRVSLAA